MKSWRKPEAVGQEFAANEYISACTVTVKCDYWPSGLGGWVKQLDVPDSIEGFGDWYYEPCDTEYTYDVNVTELKEVTFTHEAYGEPIGSHTAYYWIETSEDGGKDFHVSSITADQIAAANKS